MPPAGDGAIREGAMHPAGLECSFVMPEPDKQAHSELASFGEELRREREIRGISLKEIADATKVSKRFLEAIERNDHRTLPAPVFTRGFVREYARYLGLNAEEMVNRYNYAAAGDDRIEQSAHLERLAHPVDREIPVREAAPRARRDIPPPYARVDRNIYGLLILVGALAGVIYWAISHKREMKRVETAVVRPVAAGHAAARTSAPPTVPASTTTSTASNPSSTAADGMLHLTIDFVGNSWVELEADGKQVLADEVEKGQKRTFDAKDEFRFRKIGNAAGVDLTLNGVHVASLGGQGKVIHDRVFNRQTLQALPASGTDRTVTP